MVEEPQGTTPSTPQPTAEEKDIQENKAITILSYLGILCLIPLLAKKESKFAQYHAKQGVVLLICEVVTYVIWIIPFLGWVLGFLATIFWLVLAIIGIVNVIGGKMKELPIIGKFGEKIKI